MRLISAGSKVQILSGPVVSFWIFHFGFSIDEPVNRQSDNGAGTIDQYVVGRAGPGRDEGLMEFVEHGIERGKDEREPEYPLTAKAERAKQQRTKDGVFGEVRAF